MLSMGFQSQIASFILELTQSSPPTIKLAVHAVMIEVLPLLFLGCDVIASHLNLKLFNRQALCTIWCNILYYQTIDGNEAGLT